MSQDTQLAHLQALQSQLQHMAEQADVLENQSKELQGTQEALEELSQHEQTSALVQVASGVFSRAEIKNVQELIVNVGAGIFVKKSRKDIIAQIQKQRDTLMELQLELQKHQQQLIAQARQLQDHVQVS